MKKRYWFLSGKNRRTKDDKREYSPIKSSEARWVYTNKFPGTGMSVRVIMGF
ncbi:MAG: hypothetical protein ABSF52_11420 [Syntrophobacteraceae bacterium]